jgi:hypothetical protein
MLPVLRAIADGGVTGADDRARDAGRDEPGRQVWVLAQGELIASGRRPR